MAKQTFTTGQVLTAAQMTSLQETAMGGGPATAKTASYVLVAADAGTTVAMNAAGSTTITVNTGLFAAGDTVFIQNLGAGACTVTAGTATVATAGSLILPQNDAGILYFTATGAAIFYDYIQAGAVSPLTTKGDLYTFSTSDARLGVGANGTTLVADSSEATGLKWQAAAASSSGIGCSLSMSTTVLISGSTYTAILFNTEEFDTDSFHSTSSNTSRITIPSGKSGRYQVNASLAWSNVTGDLRNIVIYKNGSLYQECPYIAAGADGRTHAQTSLVMDLVATDYIEVYAYQNKGTTVGIWGNDTYAKGTNFSVALL